MKRNILLKIAYDGTGFSGWQRQANRRTVQGEIERVLSKLCKTPITIEGSGRTDAGVHGLGQCATFSGEFAIPTGHIKFAANNLLDKAIHIWEATEVAEDFHARFSATGKKYTYQIINSQARNPFMRHRAYYVSLPLNVEAMRMAASKIIGTHDFKCFEGAGSNPRETTIRTISSLEIKESASGEHAHGKEIELSQKGDFAEQIEHNKKIAIEIVGNGFLYKMVRNITGTLVDIGLDKIRPEEIDQIIESKDRARAGYTAPPQGLYLTEVYY